MGWLNRREQEESLLSERDELRKSVRALKDEKATLEHQKKLEIEEIKHLNRLAQEKRDIELEREKAKVQREYAEKVNKLELENRDALTDRLHENHDKIVKLLETHNKDMREVTTSVYKDIIARLPNVNVTMKR